MITSILATISFGARQETATYEVTEKEHKHFNILADHGETWTLLPLEGTNIEKISAAGLPYGHFFRRTLDVGNGTLANKEAE